jgi:uncharacterized protein (DUF1778 family)
MADEQATQKLGSPISVEFTSDGRQAIRRAAYLTEQSLSAFVRAAALKAAARVNDSDRKAA